MMSNIGIVLGLATIIILMMRRWNALLVGMIASAVIILFAGLPYSSTMISIYFEGFIGMFKSLFPIIFSGALLAQIYNRSGAVHSIGDRLANALFKEHASPSRKYVSCILAIVISCGLVTYCGMNAFVALLTMYPITLRLMEKAGIPKRFVMGILSAGVYTFSLTGPGSAEPINILAMEALGTSSYSGLCGGIVAIIVEIIVVTVVMTKMIKRDVAKGAVFAYGPKDIVVSNDMPKPKAWYAMIPLIVLIVLFNFFSVHIFTAALIAWLLSIAMFWKYIPTRNGSKRDELFDSFNVAMNSALLPCASGGSLMGFAAISQSLPEFQGILDRIFACGLPPAIILILGVCFIAGFTGTTSAAIRVGLPLVADRCHAAGLSYAYIHRVWGPRPQQ